MGVDYVGPVRLDVTAQGTSVVETEATLDRLGEEGIDGDAAVFERGRERTGGGAGDADPVTAGTQTTRQIGHVALRAADVEGIDNQQNTVGFRHVVSLL